MRDQLFDQYAKDCFEQARDADPERRILLLQMAQSWRRLADQADHITGLLVHVEPKGHA